MKRTIIIMTALLAIAAGLGWYLTQSTKITVRAELSDGGENISSEMTWIVGEALDETQPNKLSTNNTENTYSSVSGDEFEVPHGLPVTIIGQVEGHADVKTIVTPDRGAVTEHMFTLNAGLVEVTILGDATSFYAESDADNAQFNIDTNRPKKIVLAPGTYQLSTGNRLSDIRKDITVVAGLSQSITLDERRRDFFLKISSPLGWPSDLPPLQVRPFLDGIDMMLTASIESTGRVKLINLRQGEYRFDVVDNWGVVRGSREVTVDSRAQDVVVPLDYIRVNVDLEGFEGTQYPPEVQIVEISESGAAYTGRGWSGRDLVAVPFAPAVDDPDDREFAVSVRTAGKVVALQPIGRPALNEIVDVSVTWGDGHDLCVALYLADNCANSAE